MAVNFDAADVFGGFTSSTPARTAPPAAPAAAAAAAGLASGSVDPLEALLLGGNRSTATTAAAAAAAQDMASGVAGSSSGGGGATDDWGLWGSDAGAGGGSGDAGTSETTVELEGLPPPPAGVSFQSALSKGAGFSSGGQFADAIKWLVWAEALAGREGRRELATVLKTRAKCYKEAGEMKKAVADCTKVLRCAAPWVQMSSSAVGGLALI